MEPAAGAALAALVKPPSATGRSGAANRASGGGLQGCPRAAGGAGVVRERLARSRRRGSTRGRDPPRGWSTGPSPPTRPSFAVAFEHRLAHRGARRASPCSRCRWVQDRGGDSRTRGGSEVAWDRSRPGVRPRRGRRMATA